MSDRAPGYDVVFVSLENWDDVWRRNQFVCARLARRYPERKILFVAPARDVTNQLRRGRFSDLMGAPSWTVPGYPNITVTRPLKLVPNSLAAGRKWNEWLARRHVRRVMREMGVCDPVLWLNPHSAVHMAGRMSECALIYDITDDWTELSQSDGERELTIAQDAELCGRADAVIVCSERLLELKRGRNDSLHLIPNGVDPAHYRRVLDGTGPLPPSTAEWKHPVLGYTGSIHRDRVDVDLVGKLADHFTTGTIALVGPMMLDDHDRGRLLSRGNVVLTGPVAYDQVPDYMRAFDVVMTPHRMTPFTNSLNPIKLWEYLAAGKPIVSTDVSGFRDYPALVHLAADAPSFCAAVETALREPVAVREERRSEAQRHSWEFRVDLIEKVLQSSAAQKVPGAGRAASLAKVPV